MIPKMAFGRSGHMSTRTLFGAAALGSVSQQEADETLDVLLEYGVNHIDVAASYGDAELRIGPWMDRGLRDNFFLATKTGERSYEGAMRELQQSLERLRVDHIDLWQLHFLLGEEEWEVAMGEGGALQAFKEARDKGIVSYLGVTGHEVKIAERHLHSLSHFDFDSVLLPYNPTMMDNHMYCAKFNELMMVCQERNVAVQTIKSLSRRPWGEKTHTHATWYEPFDTQQEIDNAVHWVLANPRVFLNTAGDIHLLPMVLDAASRFDPALSQADFRERMNEATMEPLFT
jgi:aryl-alcohol dehydrogenase-like predicted oxidoreductase